MADSDIWSELLSTLFILLFFAIPAIIRLLSESSKRKPPQKGREPARENAYAQKIKTEQRNQFQSEWDRRQQLIRERLAALKEKEQQPFAKHAPAAAQPPHTQPPAAEILPIAAPVYEPPTAPPAPPPKPVVKAPAKPHEKYAAARAPYMTEKAPVRQQSLVKKPKPAGVRKQAARTHSALERIISQTNPLKAGIILKEILDKPKSLVRDGGF